MTSDSAILVIGATGNQGGAVARELLRRGRTVRALVRDPDKPQARDLAERGAELVRGDLEDPDSLRRAMTGAHGVFSVQALAITEDELAAEVRQGKLVADLALETGVAHLVYSSVGGAERDTGIDHFESKAEVERHLFALGVPATVLRPVFFMDNLLYFAEPGEDSGGERVLSLPVSREKPMQLIASEDIGTVAADVFDDPRTYIGTQFELAGDELTFPRIAEVYEQVSGTPTRLEALPVEERMFEWFAEEGYQADIAALRKRHSGLQTLAEFLTRRLPGVAANTAAR